MMDKKFRVIFGMFSFLILLAIPVFNEVHYPALYYGIILCLVPIFVYKVIYKEETKQNFYKKWQRRRKQGLIMNMARGGMQTILMIITVVGLTQFIVNGRAPVEIISKLPGSALVWLLFILLFFGLIGGIAGYYENEKRYEKYIRSSNYNKHY